VLTHIIANVILLSDSIYRQQHLLVI